MLPDHAGDGGPGAPNSVSRRSMPPYAEALGKDEGGVLEEEAVVAGGASWVTALAQQQGGR